MKQSILYQKPIKRFNSPSFTSQEKSSNFTPNPILENVFKLMEFIVIHEQQIQVIKQLLTERADFNPQALFYYISRDEEQIDRRHLAMLLEENQITFGEQYIKLYLNSYAYKQKLDYQAFLNLAFPVDVNLLKYISVTGIKKYSNQSTVNQEILGIFLILLQHQILMIQELDNLKAEILPKITRKEIKNLMRAIKKNSQCNSQMQIDSQPYLKYEQLRILFKNLMTVNNINIGKNSMSSGRKQNKNISSASKQQKQSISCIYSYLEKNLPCIVRKMSMGKNNFINLEELQFWLRPWNKSQNKNICGDINSYGLSNVFTISGINQVMDEAQIGGGNNQVSSRQNISFPLTHVYL